MQYTIAKKTCHVRSAIYRESKPKEKFWKNHPLSLDERISNTDKKATDWEEWDPREHEESSAFNEFPA